VKGVLLKSRKLCDTPALVAIIQNGSFARTEMFPGAKKKFTRYEFSGKKNSYHMNFFFLAQEFYSSSKKTFLVARKKISREEKKMFSHYTK